MPYSQLVGNHRKKRKGWWRLSRVLWRDTLALWREFRVPVLVFLFVTVIGGYVYGELHAITFKNKTDMEVEASGFGYTIPIIDRPYLMMQLMILESPGPAPSEWHLVIFWYALPVLLVFIVGLGAADFIHLFFNRDDRHDAWREAVVATYKNHIIVLGAGHVGIRVVKELSEMGLDIVVIDNSPDPGVEEALSSLGLPLIVADGRLSITLEKAGLLDANAFVACTGNDHLNLEVIMRVRDMNPDIRLVVRVWNDQFANQIRQFMNVQIVLSSSNLAAPAFAAAALDIELTQTLRINGTEYSMLRLAITEGSFMVGQTVGVLQSQENMDIVLHGVGDNVTVQPTRETLIKAGDTIVMFAKHETILSVISRNIVDGQKKKRKWL